MAPNLGPEIQNQHAVRAEGSIIPSQSAELEHAEHPPSLSESQSSSTTNTTTFDDEEQDLQTDLFSIYDSIFEHLKWAGFPGNYQTLSKLIIFRRNIVRVDDPGLHLVWTPDMYFIKPLPSCFYGAGAVNPIPFKVLGPYLRGLFYSYGRLIQTEPDFAIAVEQNLLPTSFKESSGWTDWLSLVHSFLTAVLPAPALDRRRIRLCPPGCPRRYQFGALRLNRLNWITWIIRPGHKDHFFQERQNPVSKFWEGYGKYIVLVNLYSTVVFKAMQVSLQAGGCPKWIANVYRLAGYIIVAAILVQIPVYIFVSVTWVVAQYIGFVLITRARRKQGVDLPDLD